MTFTERSYAIVVRKLSALATLQITVRIHYTVICTVGAVDFSTYTVICTVGAVDYSTYTVICTVRAVDYSTYTVNCTVGAVDLYQMCTD